MSSAEPLASAYAVCERLAREHYENFPVASWLLPRDMRPHVAAVYAFARVADDVADEGREAPEERQRLLDDWLARLRACAIGSPPPDGAGASASSRQIFTALGSTIRARRLPLSLFEDLLSAFRQDTTTARYETWDALLDYCRRSANPVGRLVLRITGRTDPALDRASDALCTALQLTNFWQDLERDWQKGRLYVPLEDCRVCDAREATLDAAVAARSLAPEWICALRRVAQRTRRLFDEGRSVCDGVDGRLRWELRATWLGGIRILDKLDRGGFDVIRSRPRLGPGDVPALTLQLVTWRRRR